MFFIVEQLLVLEKQFQSLQAIISLVPAMNTDHFVYSNKFIDTGEWFLFSVFFMKENNLFCCCLMFVFCLNFIFHIKISSSVISSLYCFFYCC